MPYRPSIPDRLVTGRAMLSVASCCVPILAPHADCVSSFALSESACLTIIGSAWHTVGGIDHPCRTLPSGDGMPNPREGWRMLRWILLGVAALVALGAISQSLRKARLTKWARSVPLTDEQRAAMQQLWRAFKARQVPPEDPLSHLTADDLEYIKCICSADYRPREFGRANLLRAAQFLSLGDRGYTPRQAAVIVGMTFNDVGR